MDTICQVTTQGNREIFTTVRPIVTAAMAAAAAAEDLPGKVLPITATFVRTLLAFVRVSLLVRVCVCVHCRRVCVCTLYMH